MSSFPFLIVVVVFAFVYLIVRVTAHERAERRRIELVERALESGAIDEQTKRELLEAVTGPRHRNRHGHHPVFMLGWVGLFAGLGMIGVAMNQHDFWPPAIMTTAISFGVLSIPLAARELQSRKPA